MDNGNYKDHMHHEQLLIGLEVIDVNDNYGITVKYDPTAATDLLCVYDVECASNRNDLLPENSTETDPRFVMKHRHHKLVVKRIGFPPALFLLQMRAMMPATSMNADLLVTLSCPLATWTMSSGSTVGPQASGITQLTWKIFCWDESLNQTPCLSVNVSSVVSAYS